MSQTAPAASVTRPGAILALVCLPVFIGALDLTIVSAVLPNVIVDLRIPFQTGADDAAWVVSGYLLSYTVSVALMGRVSDLIGRRRTYFIALLIFILGSWLVATATFAPAAWMRTAVRLIAGGRPDRAYMALYALVGGRVVQAFGAGAMVPVSMALVGDLYPPARRALALGVVGAVDTAGWVLGSLYGGLMVQIVAWPVLFWINIPITTLVAYVTWRQLKPVAETHAEGGLSRVGLAAIAAGVGAANLLALIEIARAAAPGGLDALADRLLSLRWLAALMALLMLAAIGLTAGSARRASRGGADWPGAALIALALIGLNIGLGRGSETDSGATLGDVAPLPPYAIVMLVIAGLALAGFILVERRSRHPLFALSHFRDRNVSLATGINLLVGFCLMVGLVSVPLFVNTVVATSLEEAALLSGLLLGALTIPMALASVPGGALTDRLGYRVPTAAGMAVAAVGFFLARGWTPSIALPLMGLHMALAGIGLGLTIAPIGTTMINAVESDERGIAAALVLVMRLIGMTLGTSIMTGYGLRRSTLLTEQMVSALGGAADVNALVEIGREVATRVIGEMMIIAAVICLMALIPALLLHPHDAAA
jgi:MFS family permease